MSFLIFKQETHACRFFFDWRLYDFEDFQYPNASWQVYDLKSHIIKHRYIPPNNSLNIPFQQFG